MLFGPNGEQLSPCAIAKAKHALGITGVMPSNNKKGSKDYWKKTVEAVAKSEPGNCKISIKNAVGKYEQYLKR